jgi:RHS repeat-associated protein
VATYSYNANNWVTSLEHTLGINRIAGFGYNYDAEGNKLYEQKRHVTTDSEAYAYDSTYRLTNFNVGTLSGSVVPSPTEQKTWLLDPVGNWGVLVSNSVPEIRTHGPANELTTINAGSLTYDANGNLQQDPAYVYAYDEANRLIQVTRIADSAIVGQYFYDALGRRIIQMTDPSGVARTNVYYYDVGRIIEELDGTGTTQATYTYGNYVDEVLTMDRGGQTYYYHQNAMWSPAAVTDSSASVAERYTYDAYGQVIVLDASYTPVPPNAWGTPHSAIGNPWLFTGRELDEETGLYFYRARYYDAAKGRFLQRDLRDYDDGPNLYMYVLDRPTRFVDPAGTQSQQCNIKGWKPLQGSQTSFPGKDKGSFKRGLGPVIFSFGYDIDIQASECETCCGDGRKFMDKKLGASISFKAELSIASYAGYIDLGGAEGNFWLGAKGTLGASASVSGTFQSDYCKGVGLEFELCGNVNIYGSIALGGEASLTIMRWWSANIGVTATATLNFPGKACWRCSWEKGCKFEKFEWQRPRVDFVVSGCIATLGCVSFSPPSIQF